MFHTRDRVIRRYNSEVWQGVVLGTVQTTDGRVSVVCEAIGKEFKIFVSDPFHLEFYNETSQQNESPGGDMPTCVARYSGPDWPA